MKKRPKLLALTLIPFLLTGCTQSISEDWDPNVSADDFVSGEALGSEICVHEKGVFYLDGELLCYYDYDSDQSFVLCSRPNCSHEDADCVAYAGGDTVGFAMYGNYAYYFRPVSDSLSWELVRVNVQAQTSDVLCSFGNPSASLDRWSVDRVESVYYSGGYAWVKLHMMYNPSEPTGYSDNGLQMVAIDLSTGELHELTEPLMYERDYRRVTWKLFSDQYVGYEFERYAQELMTEVEYEEYCAENPSETRTYSDYLAGWDVDDAYPVYWLVDIASMTQRVLCEGYEMASFDLAWTDGEKFVVSSYDSGTKTETYYHMDADGTPGDEVLRISNGGALGWYLGEASMRPYDNDSLLYLIYEGEDRCKIYKYSFETGESTYLFEDDRSVSFRLVGQTSDKLIGKINESSQWAWIEKQDYEAGNFKAIHKFNVP